MNNKNVIIYPADQISIAGPYRVVSNNNSGQRYQIVTTLFVNL